MLASKNWLVHGRQTDDDIMRNWHISYGLRKKEFETQMSAETLLVEWPILQSAFGKTLVCFLSNTDG